MYWLPVLQLFSILTFVGTRRYFDLRDFPELQWRTNLSEALDWNSTEMNQSKPSALVPYVLYRIGCVLPLL